MADEKAFETKVKTYLASKKIWTLKTWGGGFQRSGVPDLLVCCRGRFIGLELKADGGVASPLQLKNLIDVYNSGGIAGLLYPNDIGQIYELITAIEAGDEPAIEMIRLAWARRVRHNIERLET